MLEMDARQRAMLQEMGIAVWWPVALAASKTADAIATDSVALPERSISARDQIRTIKSAVQPAPAAPAAIPPQPAVADDAARQSAIAGMDWLALQNAVPLCRACALCSSRSQTVFGCGQERPYGTDEQTPPIVDWLILGDAPGQAEELQGQPFAGLPGALLDKMLQAVRLRTRLHPDGGNPLGRYTRVYLSNVVKCRPPAGRNPQAQELAQCQPYLARQIELLQPKLILALDRLAANTLLSEHLPDVAQTPLGKLRGKVYAWRGIPVVVSYPPDYLLRNPLDKAKAWEDLCLAMQASG